MSIGNDNPNPISDGAQFFLTDSAGFRQLFQIKSADPQMQGGVTEEVGAGGVLGSKRQAGGFTISAVSVVSRGVADEADWDGLRDDDEFVTFEIQYVGNARHVFENTRISTVNTTAGEDGTVTRNIAMYAPRRNIVS
jgi:hypothetical protein